MLSAIDLENSYVLIEMIVCNRGSNICMFHRCENCPGLENVEQFSHDYLNPNDLEKADSDEDIEDIEDIEETEINFKQWTTTDRTGLTSITLPLNEFIARSQSSYLKHLKETMN